MKYFNLKNNPITAQAYKKVWTFSVRRLVLIPVVCLISLSQSYAHASTCTPADIQKAKEWDDPSTEEAYEFGLKLQSIVRKQNITSLFELVDGELGPGPRKKYVVGKKFGDLFDEDWTKRVLSSKPPCARASWRGYMMGDGLIWYDKNTNGKWEIHSTHGAKEEETSSTLPVGWTVSGGVLSLASFAHGQEGGVLFDEFFLQFSIKDFEDLLVNTGKYFGKEISHLKPIKPEGCDDDSCSLSLVRSLDIHKTLPTNVRIKGREIQTTNPSESYISAYEIIGRVSQKTCQSLAPHLKGRCEQSYLVFIDIRDGGTLGNKHYNIYGLFALDSGRKVIVPLKSFGNRNEALNYIDAQN